MPHIPFDTRSIKYDDHSFKNNKIQSLKISEEYGPSTEPYEYFEGKFRHKGTGMSNLRHKKKKNFPVKNGEEAVKLELVEVEKPKDSENKRNGVLTKPAGAAAAAAAGLPISNEISKSFHSKKDTPSATTKRKSSNYFNNKINSIVGRSAFKPSLIITADKPKSSLKKRIKQDIFGTY
jgi:hypothetical protein